MLGQLWGNLRSKTASMGFQFMQVAELHIKTKNRASFTSRFKLMGDGSYKRMQQGKAHLNTGTSKRKLLALRQPAYTSPEQSKLIRKVIPTFY